MTTHLQSITNADLPELEAVSDGIYRLFATHHLSGRLAFAALALTLARVIVDKSGEELLDENLTFFDVFVRRIVPQLVQLERSAGGDMSETRQ